MDQQKLNKGLAQMLKGGVIMDVVTAEQAKISEEAGAVSVMALERVPSDIRKTGGVARMSDPKLIKEIFIVVKFIHYDQYCDPMAFFPTHMAY